MLILVMMQVVIAPQGFHKGEGGIPGMNGIVHAAIHEVSQQEARKKHKGPVAHDEVLNGKNNAGQDNTGYRGHKEPLTVAGKVVVIAMHDVGNLFTGFGSGGHVKQKPVGQILKDGPAEDTDDPGGKYLPAGKT
jgi:hypothetical protein